MTFYGGNTFENRSIGRGSVPGAAGVPGVWREHLPGAAEPGAPGGAGGYVEGVSGGAFGPCGRITEKPPRGGKSSYEP